MTNFTPIPSEIEKALEKSISKPSRRDFLKKSGRLVVSFSAASVVGADLLSAAAFPQRGRGAAAAAPTPGSGPYPDPNYHQLDSWIVIHQDNTATFYVG